MTTAQITAGLEFKAEAARGDYMNAAIKGYKAGVPDEEVGRCIDSILVSSPNGMSNAQQLSELWRRQIAPAKTAEALTRYTAGLICALRKADDGDYMDELMLISRLAEQCRESKPLPDSFYDGVKAVYNSLRAREDGKIAAAIIKALGIAGQN